METTGYVVISCSSAEVVREVELTEREEIERGEYRHVYGDGSESWVTLYETEEEALAEARKYGRFVHRG